MVSEQIESSMASAPSSPSPQLSPTAYFSVTLPSALTPISIRLDRSNFTLRRSQILPTVRAYELEGFLIGTQSQPQFRSVNSDYTHWCRLDQFLLCLILSSMTESMLGHVLYCHTPSEIWKTLEQFSSTRSKARILNLRYLLKSIKKGCSPFHTESMFLYMKIDKSI